MSSFRIGAGPVMRASHLSPGSSPCLSKPHPKSPLQWVRVASSHNIVLSHGGNFLLLIVAVFVTIVGVKQTSKLRPRHAGQSKYSINSLLRARRQGHSLPADLYTRADVFEAEIDVLFHKHWIFIGLECDVPEPGDVCVLDIGRSSVAIVRDDDGVVRAFFNVCRHRGAKLLPAGSGVVGNLVCPYHQWTYSLTGELLRAPHMGRDFDLSCNGLRPIALRSVGGLLYTCLSDDPPSDIQNLADVMEPRLAPYDIRNAKIAFQTDTIEKGNWKFTLENNRECYHCSANHPELCVSFY